MPQTVSVHLVNFSVHKRSIFILVMKCLTLLLHIGVGDGEGGHVPPKIRENFFRQLLCKIRAFFGLKSCKIREFC